MTGRLAFLSHFVICLAVAGVAFFAWTRGVFQTVYANDASMMTSAIAALFVGTAIWLGWQAWRIDSGKDGYINHRVGETWVPGAPPMPDASTDFADRAERWSVMLGLLGTTLGLSLQAKALAGGSTSFTALATSLFTTGTGIGSALLIGVMAFSLDAHIKRARR